MASGGRNSPPTIINKRNKKQRLSVDDPATTILVEGGRSQVLIVQGSGNGHSTERGEPVPLDRPTPTVMAGGGKGQFLLGEGRRKFTIAEVRRLCGFPDDFELKGTYAQQWERLGNAVPPVMMQHLAESIRDNVLR